MLSEPDICSTIIGNDSLEQLKENIAIFESEPLAPEILKGIRELFSDVPESVVNPALWAGK